jgi:hypothetical protein
MEDPATTAAGSASRGLTAMVSGGITTIPLG